MWQADNGAPELPDKKEQERRKKILEDDLVKYCPEYGWDKEKALWALKEGILTMEPVVFDWTDDWPSGSLKWAEGFNSSYLCEPFEKLPWFRHIRFYGFYHWIKSLRKKS